MKAVKLVTFKAQCNQQAVEHLETLLRQAKDGEISEFVMSYKRNNVYEHCWTGCENLVELLGMLTRLMYITQRRMDTE